MRALRAPSSGPLLSLPLNAGSWKNIHISHGSWGQLRRGNSGWLSPSNHVALLLSLSCNYPCCLGPFCTPLQFQLSLLMWSCSPSWDRPGGEQSSHLCLTPVSNPCFLLYTSCQGRGLRLPFSLVLEWLLRHLFFLPTSLAGPGRETVPE